MENKLLKVFISGLARSCGTNAEWHEMQKDLQEAITEIQQLKKEFWSDLKIPGELTK